MLDGGEIARDVSFESSPVGGKPTDILNQGHAGNGEGAGEKDKLDESPKSPADENSRDITSTESR